MVVEKEGKGPRDKKGEWEKIFGGTSKSGKLMIFGVRE